MATISNPMPNSTFRERILSVWPRIKAPFFYILLIFWALICLAPLYFTLVFAIKPVSNS